MQPLLWALLVLAWTAIVFLTFGFAGLVTKVRALEANGGSGTAATNDPARRWPDLAAPDAGHRTLALVVSSTCPTCEEVAPAWSGLRRGLGGAGHRTVLIDIDGSGTWNNTGAGEILPGPGLSSPLLLAYQPALLVIDADGTMLAAEPVGSVESLKALTEEYLGGTTPPSTTSSLTTGVAS
ncbi:hypothetical protein [Streptomyces qinzhouensis]|uniref:Thioredoxin domain-containing protein n=1 Tax=Streptomyces qinzhouensis TaxID=2599401 RepID=A0A5B8JHJ7_9ACTN|nr:hypothetical protein [Streptomyces qinzhouensis]QDY77270.1 hypothetical protein FQU76_12945 [Streptomyces qinzhouensis]